MHAMVLQHAAFEGPGLIADWASARGHEMSLVDATTGEFPQLDGTDLVVVLGGPMRASDSARHPWLADEKHFLADAIASGRPVLGICLGAQIIAEVLGGRVRRNEEVEIGWHVVRKTHVGATGPFFSGWPQTMVVGQWHADTFELPLGMEPALSSEACRNQAYVFDDGVVGLQFHIEWTQQALDALLCACVDELGGGELWVQSAEEIRDEAPERIAECREFLFDLLDQLCRAGLHFTAESIAAGATT